MAKAEKLLKVKPFKTEFTVKNALIKGDIFTKLTTLIMGLGNIVRGQIIKGFLFLIAEAAFIYYMVTFGVQALLRFPALGTKEQGEVFDEAKQIYVYVKGDNSMLILLYGIITMFIILAFIVVWRAALKSAYEAEWRKKNGKSVPNLREDIHLYFDSKMHKTLLFLPAMGVLIFTIMPLIFMISMAFTNYDRDHQAPGKLFDWIGLDNFVKVLDFSGDLGRTFWPVLGWTIVWAIFATFLNYILGMILAIVINRKDTKLKSLWRFAFVLSMAVPQFVSLLIMKSMLQPDGAINVLLRELGLIAQGASLPFLTNATWARVTVIVINIWVGIPYTILTVTGVLQNIPADLYESAKVDGANAIVTFFKITLPYMLFVTAPSLITTFIGNINNFNVIFLLTGGAPATMDYYKGTAGKTDLLVTWLYKLTIDNKDYSYGAVIGILVFVLCATSALIVYRRTGSYKNEEGFQ